MWYIFKLHNVLFFSKSGCLQHYSVSDCFVDDFMPKATILNKSWRISTTPNTTNFFIKICFVGSYGYAPASVKSWIIFENNLFQQCDIQNRYQISMYIYFLFVSRSGCLQQYPVSDCFVDNLVFFWCRWAILGEIEEISTKPPWSKHQKVPIQTLWGKFLS